MADGLRSEDSSSGALSMRRFREARLHEEIQWVFFDASGTLIRPEPGFTDSCVQLLAQRGIVVEQLRISDAERKADVIYETHRRHMPRLYSNALSERCVWSHYFAELMCQLAQGSPEGTNWLEYGYEVNDFFDRSENWVVYDDVIFTLEGLRSLGKHMGVISDFGERLPDHLQRLHLQPYFEVVLVSSLVNLCKSDGVQIFEAAAAMAKATSGQCLMVGDNYATDIVPARKLGFTAVWLQRPSGSSPEVGGASIISLQALLEWFKP